MTTIPESIEEPMQRRFVAALHDLELPDTDVSEAILARLAADHPDGAAERGVRHRPALVLMAAAALVMVIVLAVAPARDAVARFFGIGATKVEFVPANTGPATDSTDVVDTGGPSIGSSAEVPVTVDPIPVLGPPAAAFDADVANGRRYTWPTSDELSPLAGTDVGLVLSVRESDGPLDIKRVAADVDVEFVQIDVDGQSVMALWIDGAHEYAAADTSRVVRSDRVLVWEVDGVQYRLEANLSVERMRELAASTHGGTELLQPG